MKDPITPPTAPATPTRQDGWTRTAPTVGLAFVLGVTFLTLMTGCGGSPTAQARAPKDRFTAISDTSAGRRSIKASRLLFDSAAVVVVADASDHASLERAATAGADLGVPVLAIEDGVSPGGELERLGTKRIINVGGAKLDPAATGGRDVEPVPRGTRPVLEVTGDKARSDGVSEPTDGRVLAIVSDAAADSAAAATARAAGVKVLRAPGADPRATAATVETVSQASKGPKAQRWQKFVSIGARSGDRKVLEWRVRTAATGVQLPGGGQLVFPGKRYVALYGSPGVSSLGALGRQDVPATVTRVAELAKEYEAFSGDPVIPGLEIIASIATAAAGPDGDYSNTLPSEKLRPLIDAAHEAGQYVVIDLQPGRSTFLDQARHYRDLLELPYVGLGLDPEWNLGPDQVHLRQIGSTTADEINDVVNWLANLVRDRSLPQKMLVLHQFQVRMIPDIAEVDQSRSELAVLVHADGQGTQPQKQETWKALRRNAPDIEWWGWKNFFEKDKPMLTPKGTAWVDPFPNLITYQ